MALSKARSVRDGQDEKVEPGKREEYRASFEVGTGD